MNLRALTVSLAWLLAAGCAPLPPSPADARAKRFEVLPGKAVIYIARDDPDFNGVPATITLGERGMVTTYPGTYYRWEVEPGRHEIAGYGADNGTITLQVEAGKIYYVQQSTLPWLRYAVSDFVAVPEAKGRAVVMRGELLGAW